MSDEVLPSWMSDGKGLQGDAAPVTRKRLEFPTAQVSRVDGGGGMTDEVGRQVTSPDGGFIGYPWEKQSIDNGAGGAIQDYNIWFGSGTSSFATADTNAPLAIPIKAFEIEVADPDPPTENPSSMSLIVGDDDTDNDGLNFTYDSNLTQIDWTTQCEIYMSDSWDPGDEDAQTNGNQIDIFLDETNSGSPTISLQDGGENSNEIEIYLDEPNGGSPTITLQDDGTDGNEIDIYLDETNGGTPTIGMTDNSDNELLLQIDGYPKIFLSDVYDDPDSGNSVQIDLETGPEIVLKDDSDNSITIDINDDPEIVLSDSADDSGNSITINIDGSPGIRLDDGDGGNSIVIDIDDGPEIVLDDGDENTITIDINDEPEIVINQSDGGSATLSAGELDLSDSEGNSSTLDGNSLNLDGADGASISLDTGDIGGGAASFQQCQVCVDGAVQTAYVLMTTPS